MTRIRWSHGRRADTAVRCSRCTAKSSIGPESGLSSRRQTSVSESAPPGLPLPTFPRARLAGWVVSLLASKGWSVTWQHGQVGIHLRRPKAPIRADGVCGEGQLPLFSSWSAFGHPLGPIDSATTVLVETACLSLIISRPALPFRLPGRGPSWRRTGQEPEHGYPSHVARWMGLRNS